MKRWLPYPLTSGALLAVWLLANQSLSPGQILLGVILALGLPLLARPMRPLGDPHVARAGALLKLLALSTVEIVRSTFNVCRIILFYKPAEIRSQFIRVPLDLRDPYGLALLSCLINMTPGTVWVELLSDNRVLALHVFDLHDEAWWVNTIKTHYEKPIMDIFESGKNLGTGNNLGTGKDQ